MRLVIVAVMGLLALAGCFPSTVGLSAPPQLSDGWSVGSLADAGFDQVELTQLTAEIEGGAFPNTHALLIEHDGSLVYERYFTGTDERWGGSLGKRTLDRDGLHDLRSISKNVTSTLLGIALGEQLDAAVQRPVGSYLPGLDLPDEVESVTLHHVLTMTAGLAWNEMEVPYTDAMNDEIRLYSVENPAEYVLTRPRESEPGSTWYYSGGLTQVLAGIIQELTGQRLDDYARVSLFEPLGITELEWLGPGRWSPDQPAAMSGLRLRGRDLAKIGSVFLHGGRWNGRQVVPERWVELSMKRWVGEIDRWSMGGTWGYGYQWWSGHLRDGRQIVAGFGNGNQRLFILPQDRLVVTIFAGQYNRSGHSDSLFDRVLGTFSKPR